MHGQYRRSFVWQDQKPFNLNNYKYNVLPYNLPYRIINKICGIVKGMMGKPYVQRNWELQFLGEENSKNLEGYLYDKAFTNLVSKEIIDDIYEGFKIENNVKYSHPLSMLLTLSLWYKNNN